MKLLITTLLLVFGASSAYAYTGLALYTATITSNDRVNSHGARLKTLREVLRQDRANYCKRIGKNHASRGDATYFCSSHNRNIFDRARINIHRGVANQIVHGRRSVSVCVMALSRSRIDVSGGRCRDV